MVALELLEAVKADGAHWAREAFRNKGWRRAPAQSPLVAAALKGKSYEETMALLEAWNSAYQAAAREEAA